MPYVYSPGFSDMVMAMDYNFWVKFNNGADQPASAPELRTKVRQTYDYMYDQTYNGNRAPLILGNHFNAWNNNAYEKALTSFLDDCAARAACAFHEGGKPAKAFDTLMASIDAKPLPATLAHDRRSVGPGIAEYAVLAALYSQESWPVLANSLALAKRGDGSLMLAIADPYQGRKPNGSYSNQHDAYTANTCLDFTAPTDVATYTDWAHKLEASAPHFAQLIAYNDLACAFWPVPPERIPATVSGAGAPPIVVVGTTGDPATPYAWAQALAKELTSAVLVTHEGEGHTAYLTDSCVQRAVNEYLLGLTAPKAG
jgi:hypothetical protein